MGSTIVPRLNGVMAQSQRMADVAVSLSLATDLGTGQPMSHGMRTCLVATRAAEALGLGQVERSCVYYVAVLRFLGCTADASATARLVGGDEVRFNAVMAPVLMGGAAEVARRLVGHVGQDLPVLRRAGRVTATLTARRATRSGRGSRSPARAPGCTRWPAATVAARDPDRRMMPGPPRALRAAVDAVTVAPDGDRVAWRKGARVHVGAVRKGRLSSVDDTLVPIGAVPVGFVGAGLLLGRRPAEALAGSYALWWPSRGEIDGPWRIATGVYGALPDGRTVVAQIPAGDGEPCLALLDAGADLAVREQACDVPLTAGAAGWVSPDGRWLVAERTAEESVLVDVTAVFDGDEQSVGAGPRPNGPGAWTDGSTVVYGGDGYLARLRVDEVAHGDADAVERITVRGVAGRPVLAVPTLPVG
jgi:hypothetical protein